MGPICAAASSGLQSPSTTMRDCALCSQKRAISHENATLPPACPTWRWEGFSWRVLFPWGKLFCRQSPTFWEWGRSGRWDLASSLWCMRTRVFLLTFSHCKSMQSLSETHLVTSKGLDYVAQPSNLIHTNLIPAIKFDVAATYKSNWIRLRK